MFAFLRKISNSKKFILICVGILKIIKNYREKILKFYDDPDIRSLKIFIRNYSLGYTIRNSLPWEEFSIGFQARFIRNPDVYNFRFWDYFQNDIINQIQF